MLYDQTIHSIVWELHRVDSDVWSVSGLPAELIPGRGPVFGHQFTATLALRYAMILADERNSAGSTTHDKPHDVKFDLDKNAFVVLFQASVSV